MTFFYHYPCVDGMVAAWVANSANPGSRFVPLDYGNINLEEIGAWMVDQDVVFLDCSLKAEQFDVVAHHARSIKVIDHHKTCPVGYVGVDFVFDINHSGAMLAWKQYHGDAEPPTLVKYVEDRDLWRWSLPHSKEINAYISVFNLDFGSMTSLDIVLSHDFDAGVDHGQAILTYQRRLIDRILANQKDGVVNSPILQSELGEALAEKYPFGTVWYINAEGKKVVSLRSKGDVDVSEIAKQHGGGGHKNAAGYTV